MQAFFARFGYVAVFAALAAAGLGVPIPEELTQLTVGALSHEAILDLRIALPVVWVGIVCGDTILFMVARRHGQWLLRTRPARRVLTANRVAMLQRHFARHAFWTIVAARHTGGVRFAAFALAGVSGVRPLTFIVADALSALVSVPLVVGAGYLFWHHLSEARRGVRIVELAILVAVAVGVGVALLVRKVRARRAAARVPGGRPG